LQKYTGFSEITPK